MQLFQSHPGLVPSSLRVGQKSRKTTQTFPGGTEEHDRIVVCQILVVEFRHVFRVVKDYVN
jgi:hypothetical protein